MRLRAAVFVGLCFLAPAASLASRPVCFPERTVMWTARLRDDKGLVLGWVRGGQVVHVLDDHTGSRGEESLVEVQDPIPVRGLIERRHLLVFAARDIELEKNWSWIGARAPLWVVSGAAADEVLVEHADPHWAPFGAVFPARCADLRGTPDLPQLQFDECHGAAHRPPAPSSEGRVEWPTPPTIEGPAGQVIRPIGWGFVFGFVRRERQRTLVDVLDHDSWRRWRGWTDDTGMREPHTFWATSHLCCEGMIHELTPARAYPTRKLAAAAPLAPRPGAYPPFATLPTGESVTVVALNGSNALVVAEARQEGRSWPTEVLRGWIPAQAIADPPRQLRPLASDSALLRNASVTPSTVVKAVDIVTEAGAGAVVDAIRNRDGRSTLPPFRQALARSPGGGRVAVHRMGVLSGFVGREPSGRCREVALVDKGGGNVFPVRPDCSFSLLWDDLERIHLRGLRDPWLDLEVIPRQQCERHLEAPTGTRICTAQADILDLCLAGPCPAQPAGAHVLVHVSRDPRMLAPGATVTARQAGKVLASCDALRGACFLHDLPIRVPIEIEARQGERLGRATWTFQPGVIEDTVPLQP